MADENGNSGDPGKDAPETEDARSAPGRRVLENLAELEPQLVNAGIFDESRNPLALTSGSGSWPGQARALLDALEEGSAGEEFDSAHIASAGGEVFVVSDSGLSLVAVTGRYVLASLTSYDMRMALRDVAGARARTDRVKPSPEAEKDGSDDA